MGEVFDKGIGKVAHSTKDDAAPAPLDLATNSLERCKRSPYTSSDEKLVKANLLPAMPHFANAESLVGAQAIKTNDAGQSLETRTLANSLIPGDTSTNLKEVLKFDKNGAVASSETSWNDTKNRTHDVLTANGKTTNTIVDGTKTEKLITYAAGPGWEHDTIVKSDDGKKTIFKDLLTVGDSGHINFEDKFLAETKSGKLDFHRWARYDKEQTTTNDDGNWRDKNGAHEQFNPFDYGDAKGSKLCTVQDANGSFLTESDATHPPKTVKVDKNGNVTGEDGVTRNPAGEVVQKETW